VEKTKKRDPKWLQPLWEKKKKETARRVERAVKEMVKRHEPVTLDGIRSTIHSLFGISISANTVQRNELAYAAYREHRVVKATSKPRNTFAALLRSLPASTVVNVRAKINRLRPESKDALIARLLALEEEGKRHAEREDTLRDEILRLHPANGGDR